MLLIGDDWAEDHHDIEVQDETGRKLAAARLPEGVEGIAKLHELIAHHGGDDPDPAKTVVGIETDRGSWVQALIASGYQVYAINPRQVARFKERYASSGAKSDKGDAHALADMVRIDRAQLRPVAGDSEQTQAFSALRVSPGARRYYDKQRAREAGYNPTLRQLGNRLVGILHGCLKTHTRYDETTAWSHHAHPHAA